MSLFPLWEKMKASALREILPQDETIRLSTEPCINYLDINFVYGPDESCYIIQVPLECFNNEVYPELYRVRPFRRKSRIRDLDKGFFQLFIQLPKCDMSWVDAFSQFVKYLKPSHKNNKRVTNSPVEPVYLLPSVCVPLYVIATFVHFPNLIEGIEGAVTDLKSNQFITVLTHLSALKELGIQYDSFDRIVHSVFTEEALFKFPSATFNQIKSAPAVQYMIELIHVSQDPPSIIEFLYSSFHDFTLHPEYQPYFEVIINHLVKDSAKAAFIVWCYSCFIPSIDGQAIIEPFLPDFVLIKFEMTYHLQIDNVKWLIDHLDLEKNKQQVMHIAGSWVSFSTELEASQEMFDFAISKGLFDFQKMDGRELCHLLPFAKDEKIFNQIRYELKCNDIQKWRLASEAKNKNLNYLTWSQLNSVFNLESKPYPSLSKSKIMSEMRLQYRFLDSIFYHWILYNQNDVNTQIITEYLNIIGIKQSMDKSLHRKIKIMDILSKIKEPEAIKQRSRLKDEFTSQKTSIDFTGIMNHLLNKKNIDFCEKTLAYVQKSCERCMSLMTFFCNLLEKFYSPLPENLYRYLSPVNEASVGVCIRLLAQREINNDIVYTDTLSLLNLVLGTLPIETLDIAIKIFPFDKVFSNTQVMLLINEDIALYYWLMSDPDPQKYCDQGHPAINWPHVSLRAMDTICEHKFFLQYQFEIEDDNIISRYPPNKVGFLAWWCQNLPPRPGTYTNLATLVPDSLLIYILAPPQEVHNNIIKLMASTGFQKVDIVYPNKDTEYIPGYDAYVVYMPTDETTPVEIGNLLDGFVMCKPVPLSFSANAIKFILTYYPDHWYKLTSVDHKFEFNENFMNLIEWNIPSPTLLPRKHDLFFIEIEDGDDFFYKSISFRAKNQKHWSAKIEMKNGRIFGGCIANTAISVFNFDLWLDPTQNFDNQGECDLFIHWVRLRQTSLCLASLICQSNSMVSAEFTPYYQIKLNEQSMYDVKPNISQNTSNQGYYQDPPSSRYYY